MSAFDSLRDLFLTLAREERLLSDMFKRRRAGEYKTEVALEWLDRADERLRNLTGHGVLREHGQALEIEDVYLRFFETVLDASEEINVSYIHENLEKIANTIQYYLNENDDRRKFDYIRAVKSTLASTGGNTLRNVVELTRGIDTAFKTEPNYKNKLAKLKHLDDKCNAIKALIAQTQRLIDEDESAFFKAAADEELRETVVRLKLVLNKSAHSLIELQRQIIDYLNQIKRQSVVVERVRRLKFLRDRFTIESDTDIKETMGRERAAVFEASPTYPLALSLNWLQNSEEARRSIMKVAARTKSGVGARLPVAGEIDGEYLRVQTEETVQANLEEAWNSFSASGRDLADFVFVYDFGKAVAAEERVSIFCRLVSQYEAELDIRNEFKEKAGFDLAVVQLI